jgi:translation initiation factor IF-2
MAEDKSMRISLVAKQINVGVSHIVQHLSAKGYKIESSPNTKLSFEQLEVLAKDFNHPGLLAGDSSKKSDDSATNRKGREDDDLPLYFRESGKTKEESAPVEASEPAPAEPTEPELIRAEAKLTGPKILGKIDLDALNKPKATPPAPAPPVQVVDTPTPVVVVPMPIPATPEPPTAVVPEVVAPTPPPPVAEVVAPPVPEIVPPKAIEPPKEEPKPELVIETTPAPVAVEIPQPTPPAEPAPAVEIVPPPVVVPPAAPEPTAKVVDAEPKIELIEAKAERLAGLKVVGKIELPVERRPSSNADNKDKKKKRKRIRLNEQVSGGGNNNDKPTAEKGPDNKPAQAPKPGGGNNNNANNANRPPQKNNQGGGKKDNKKPVKREEISDKEVQDSIKATFARLTSNKPSFGADKRRERRKMRAEQEELRQQQEQEDSKTLKVTEFISANDMASLMDVPVQEVIATCMSMGMFVSINQRLDAEAIAIIADEFGYDVQFVSAEEEIEAALIEEEDAPENLVERAPIVTIMGHVDHGKTSLLDYIRKTRIAAGEAGGITQHIGAYSVMTDSGKRIAFLDTPGHEAFTAMRARGAKVTDVVIIVIAADDSVMPQTREAINHAQNAGVPIVFAFSKVDKPGANSEKIREELANMNLLVEDWGGKYQSQEISSKSGMGISDLLEKVLLEAELLELKSNPNKRAVGTVIEASLDKGRGYVSTILVQNGTMRVGDIILAGAHQGRVKAMFDYRGTRLKEAGPSTPVLMLGLSGAPTAGDKVNVMENEREARDIANKREQILREQNLRTRKHITLEEIGRRKAIGTFKELNVIVKGDVDGSVEALSDALLKLSTEEVQVRIIHKAVGQVSEGDVLLASAGDAIIVAFQVRPSINARRIAEQEQIEIRTYSIIYQAIDDVKDAMEGLLAPKVEEIVTANIEIRDVFKISKIGTVAGCYVTDGTVKRNHKIRVIRDFVVVHEGEISALKRYKDDVGEVKFGYECGLSIKNYNDIQVGDNIECYELREVKRSL